MSRVHGDTGLNGITGDGVIGYFVHGSHVRQAAKMLSVLVIVDIMGVNCSHGRQLLSFVEYFTCLHTLQYRRGL